MEAPDDKPAINQRLKSKRWQLQGRHLYLTYPRCDLDPGVVNERIMNSLDPEWSITCRERHQMDENHTDEWTTDLHVHCVVRLKKKRSWSSPTCLDYLTSQHGNYQTARNVRDVVLYVTKGKDYVSEGVDVAEFKKSARKKQKCVDTRGTLVEKIIADGGTEEDVRGKYPGFFFHNRRKVKDHISYIRDLKAKTGKRKWVEPKCENGSFPAEVKIIKWLQDNILQSREFKKPQLWVWGKMNTGKTRLIEWLEQFLCVYHIPRNKWDDTYSDDYQLAVIDEFKGTKTIGWMNLFVQGSATPLQRRGCSDYIKRANIPVIVCSNFSIEDAYPNTDEVVLEALKYRFVEVEIPWDETINFHTGIDPLEVERKRKRKREDNVEEVGEWKANGLAGPILIDHNRNEFIDLQSRMAKVYKRIINKTL